MRRQRNPTGWVMIASALVLVTVIGGLVIDRRITSEQLDDASAELLLLMNLRGSALGSYFDTVQSELIFWSLNENLVDAVGELRAAWSAIPGDAREVLQAGYIENNPYPKARRQELDRVDDGTLYGAAHERIHALARAFVSERGYYDFFLIDPEGNILYRVEKEDDFATNLQHGPVSDSGLADVYRRALASDDYSDVAFSDFQRYTPSADAPAIFAAVPIRETDESIGAVLAVQVPTERIQSIMQFTAGMGESGETYLVGRDYLMRSDSRFSEESTILETRVDGETVDRALAKETGVTFVVDYRGVEVLSAHGLFTLDEVEWAVIAEIDREEVYAAIARRRMSVPIIGTALLMLSMVTLWFIDVADLSILGIDAGDVSDSGDGSSL